MTFTPGTRLGVYEVVSPLDAGGMGEVYRAKDSKLKREVALKVLPADVANDRDRLARFQREAEVLASLNHPHIAQIYGIEEGDVASGFSGSIVKARKWAPWGVPACITLPVCRPTAAAWRWPA